MTIAAVVPNLFDRSRFGDRVTFVDTPAQAAEVEPTLIIVDLDRCDEPASYVVDGVSTIGFGPHVDTDVHDRAIAAGFAEVFARSVFFRRLDQLLDERAGG